MYQQGNSSAAKEVSSNGTITTVEKPKSINMTAMFSWKNVMNLFNVFDVRVSFSLIRENLGTLLSVSSALHVTHALYDINQKIVKSINN